MSLKTQNKLLKPKKKAKVALTDSNIAFIGIWEVEKARANMQEWIEKEKIKKKAKEKAAAEKLEKEKKIAKERQKAEKDKSGLD